MATERTSIGEDDAKAKAFVARYLSDSGEVRHGRVSSDGLRIENDLPFSSPLTQGGAAASSPVLFEESHEDSLLVSPILADYCRDAPNVTVRKMKPSRVTLCENVNVEKKSSSRLLFDDDVVPNGQGDTDRDELNGCGVLDSQTPHKLDYDLQVDVSACPSLGLGSMEKSTSMLGSPVVGDDDDDHHHHHQPTVKAGNTIPQTGDSNEKGKFHCHASLQNVISPLVDKEESDLRSSPNIRSVNTPPFSYAEEKKTEESMEQAKHGRSPVQSPTALQGEIPATDAQKVEAFLFHSASSPVRVAETATEVVDTSLHDIDGGSMLNFSGEENEGLQMSYSKSDILHDDSFNEAVSLIHTVGSPNAKSKQSVDASFNSFLSDGSFPKEAAEVNPKSTEESQQINMIDSREDPFNRDLLSQQAMAVLRRSACFVTTSLEDSEGNQGGTSVSPDCEAVQKENTDQTTGPPSLFECANFLPKVEQPPSERVSKSQQEHDVDFSLSSDAQSNTRSPFSDGRQASSLKLERVGGVERGGGEGISRISGKEEGENIAKNPIFGGEVTSKALQSPQSLGHGGDDAPPLSVHDYVDVTPAEFDSEKPGPNSSGVSDDANGMRQGAVSQGAEGDDQAGVVTGSDPLLLKRIDSDATGWFRSLKADAIRLLSPEYPKLSSLPMRTMTHEDSVANGDPVVDQAKINERNPNCRTNQDMTEQVKSNVEESRHRDCAIDIRDHEVFSEAARAEGFLSPTDVPPERDDAVDGFIGVPEAQNTNSSKKTDEVADFSRNEMMPPIEESSENQEGRKSPEICFSPPPARSRSRPLHLNAPAEIADPIDKAGEVAAEDSSSNESHCNVASPRNQPLLTEPDSDAEDERNQTCEKQRPNDCRFRSEDQAIDAGPAGTKHVHESAVFRTSFTRENGGNLKTPQSADLLISTASSRQRSFPRDFQPKATESNASIQLDDRFEAEDGKNDRRANLEGYTYTAHSGDQDLVPSQWHPSPKTEVLPSPSQDVSHFPTDSIESVVVSSSRVPTEGNAKSLGHSVYIQETVSSPRLLDCPSESGYSKGKVRTESKESATTSEAFPGIVDKLTGLTHTIVSPKVGHESLLESADSAHKGLKEGPAKEALSCTLSVRDQIPCQKGTLFHSPLPTSCIYSKSSDGVTEKPTYATRGQPRSSPGQSEGDVLSSSRDNHVEDIREVSSTADDIERLLATDGDTPENCDAVRASAFRVCKTREEGRREDLILGRGDDDDDDDDGNDDDDYMSRLHSDLLSTAVESDVGSAQSSSVRAPVSSLNSDDSVSTPPNVESARSPSMSDSLSSTRRRVDATSFAFLERLRGAAQQRKLLMTQPQDDSNADTESIAVPTKSELQPKTERKKDQSMNRTRGTDKYVIPFKARPVPATNGERGSGGQCGVPKVAKRSTTTPSSPPLSYRLRTKNQSLAARVIETVSSEGYHTDMIEQRRINAPSRRNAVNPIERRPGTSGQATTPVQSTRTGFGPKPFARVLSGTEASKAKEEKLRAMREREEAELREAVRFKARPMPLSTIQPQSLSSPDLLGLQLLKKLPRSEWSDSSSDDENETHSLDVRGRPTVHRKPEHRENISTSSPSNMHTARRALERAEFDDWFQANEVVRLRERDEARKRLLQEKYEEMEQLRERLRMP